MADTAVSIGCRKTIEVAGRLADWLHRRDVLAAEIKPCIATAIESATTDLRRIMRSIDFSPCVGLAGGSDLHRIELSSSSLFQDRATTISELSQLRSDQRSPGAVLEQIAGNDLGTAIRFRCSGPRQVAAGAQRFPIQVELLNTLDIVKILVAAYYSHHPDAIRKKLGQDDIQRAIAEADAQLSTAVVAGLSPEDIVSLSQHLWTQYPRVDGLRIIATSGYWDWLAKHVAYLAFDGRCSILACLWHFEPSLTALFRQLSHSLRDLGYVSSVRVPIEAIVGAEPRDGGVTAHHLSIMHKATTEGLLREDEPLTDLAVAVNQGTVRNTTRATIAALTHSVTLSVNRAAPFPLDSTDLKVFPSPSAPVDFSLELAMAVEGDTAISMSAAAQLYARAKATYVFARSCSTNELSAVVLLADADAEPDDVHMRSVGNWIDLSEGADPRARERMENCLAVLVKSPSGGEAAEENFDRAGFLAALLGENNRWAEEWTPGRPFSQIHFVPTFANGAAPSARHPVSAHGLDENVFPARLAVLAPPSLAITILLDIAANSSQVIRIRQIRRQLASIQQGIQARIFRYHRSSNPAQFTDWRRQIANVATKRLEACCEARQLGNMLAVLTLQETEIRILLAGLRGGVVEQQEIDDYSIDMNVNIGKAALPQPQFCAEAIIAMWLKLMHQAAGSRQLCHQLNIAQPVFQHIVDELVIGAHRTDLVGALTAKFERTLESGHPLGDLAPCYAAVAARTLGGFLERLAVARTTGAGDTGRLGQDGTGWTPEFTHREQIWPAGSLPGSAQAQVRGERRAAHFSGQWPTLFRQMVEDNIMSAEGLTAHNDADHELGEYLAMLTINPLEVEL